MASHATLFLALAWARTITLTIAAAWLYRLLAVVNARFAHQVPLRRAQFFRPATHLLAINIVFLPAHGLQTLPVWNHEALR